MNGMETWQSAFARQARSDFEVFKTLGNHPLCHQLHYLQMVAEKIAKSFLCEGTKKRPPRTHKVFVQFLMVCRKTRRFRDSVRMGKQQFHAYIGGLLDAGRAVEELAPAGDVDKPNPEYPWELGGKVASPLDYPFTAVRLKRPEMARLLSFLDICLKMVR